MPGYTLPLTESRIIAELLKRQRGLATGLVDSGALSYLWEKDSWTVASTPATTYTMSYLPVQNSPDVTLNGLTLLEGTDYTIDYTTGAMSVTFKLTADDKLEAAYVTTGDLVAQRTPVALQSVGWTQTSSGYSVGSVTAGVRNSGTWAYSTVAVGSPLHDLGTGDGYSVEATLSALPSSSYAQWWCAVNNAAYWYGNAKGVYFEINAGNSAAYIVLARDGVVTQVAAPGLPTVGQAVKVVVDFTARTATLFYAGTQQAQIDLTPYTWYTPDGANA